MRTPPNNIKKLNITYSAFDNSIYCQALKIEGKHSARGIIPLIEQLSPERLKQSFDSGAIYIIHPVNE